VFLSVKWWRQSVTEADVWKYTNPHSHVFVTLQVRPKDTHRRNLFIVCVVCFISPVQEVLISKTERLSDACLILFSVYLTKIQHLSLHQLKRLVNRTGKDVDRSRHCLSNAIPAMASGFWGKSLNPVRRDELEVGLRIRNFHKPASPPRQSEAKCSTF